MATVKKQPMRQCIGCREMKPKKELIRILKSEDGQFLVDSTGKKNGRGAYICNKQECLNLAMKNKGLERSLKTNVPREVYETLSKEFDA